MLKAIKAVALTVVLGAAMLFTSCAGKGPELEEIKGRVEELVSASCELNAIYYGEGLPVITESYTGTDYYFVDVEKSDYDSMDSLKEATSAVYTSDYCEGIFETMFVGISNDIGAILPRFTEGDGGVLMQDKYLKNILPGDREFLFDTMTIEKSSKNRVTVRISATLDGEKDEDAVIELRLEKGVWLLDSPTY